MIVNYLSSTSLIEAIDNQSIFDQNTEYINKHKEYVQKSYDWLKKNCPEIFNGIDAEEFQELIDMHDESKFSEVEFEPYAHKWFGDGKKTPEYEAAWEHHWQSNPHHPEYWQGKDMPDIYILEMICDWFSFGIKNNDLAEIFDFYENKAKNDAEKMLSDNTKLIIEKHLSAMKDAIQIA